MSARVLPATGRAAVENELLAQLGLSPSASPEDIDELHEAASEYLAAAPASLRGWAHAQARALDSAYLKLTDPVGLEGSALRSPTRPPTVVPGGPATPPARRGSVPAAPSPVRDPALDAGPDVGQGLDAADGDEAADFDALYAMVTPSAHADMAPDEAPRKRAASRGASRHIAKATVRVQHVQAAAPTPGRGRIWARLAVALVGVAAVVALAFGVNAVVNNGVAANAGASDQATAPAIDQAKVSQLMQQYAANPNDTTTLLALANEFYAGQQYQSAGDWLDKLLAIDPNNIQALLARGAVSYNLGDLTSAEATWNQVVALEPDNQEVHYDLGFLYLSMDSPDWAGVQREWARVIQIDPTTSLAQLVQQHLDQLAASSMLPATSPGASPAASGAASTAPAGSALPSTAPSAAPSAGSTPAVTSAPSPAGSGQP